VKRVHQVLATLGYGDAIGHEVLGIQRVLRSAGYESEIFVETADYRLEPQTLDEVFADIRRVAVALGVEPRADRVIAQLRGRVEAVRVRAATAPRRRCVLLEWIDPPFRSGHWDPELVALAGGVDPLGRSGEDAAEVAWDAVRAADPEVLVIACCGFDLARTRDDLPILRAYSGFAELPAA